MGLRAKRVSAMHSFKQAPRTCRLSLLVGGLPRDQYMPPWHPSQKRGGSTPSSLTSNSENRRIPEHASQTPSFIAAFLRASHPRQSTAAVSSSPRNTSCAPRKAPQQSHMSMGSSRATGAQLEKDRPTGADGFPSLIVRSQTVNWASRSKDSTSKRFAVIVAATTSAEKVHKRNSKSAPGSGRHLKIAPPARVVSISISWSTALPLAAPESRSQSWTDPAMHCG
mmetsp:Transcript_1221/g.2360  ORF Transcript_1221/g.2360 Transcript_1221/m.2360 type:complete len:224 (+) Transcript_1221:209-880(+)